MTSASFCTWSSVEDLVAARLPSELREALSHFPDERVARLSVPYGTKLIRHGSFEWDLLGSEGESWRESYGTKVPVGIVSSKTVELYDVISEVRLSNGVAKNVRRSVPQYLLKPGEFFGLFENLASYEHRDWLRATAGGTTLLSLPAIGAERNQKDFFKDQNIRVEGSGLENLGPHLQTTNKSKMTWGPFASELLHVLGSEWRCTLLVFSPSFFESIRMDPIAGKAIRDLALAQFRISHERAYGDLEVLREVGASPQSAGATTIDMQGLHLVAQELRPGFVPVLGTETDELVLPAKDLHSVVYYPDQHSPETMTSALDGEGAFPMFFRPSLPNEECFYFMGRPFTPGEINKKNRPVDVRIEDLIKRMSCEFEGQFWRADRASLTAWLEGKAPAGEGGLRVKMSKKEPYFLSAGIVGVKRDRLKDGD